MKKRCQATALALAVTFVLTAAPAQAQQEPNIDVERFKPAVTHDGFVTTEGSAVRPEDDRWEFSFFAN